MPGGRPTEPVPQDKAEAIIEWISSGKTLRDFCRQAGAPAFRTVYDWLDKDREFSARFARAREAGEDVIAQECLEIADDGTNDYMTITKGYETYNVEDREVTSRSKLRVETRLKLLAKWNPKKYGEKVALDVAVNDSLANRLNNARKRKP